jgi:N-glycosylase/DNA lyase
MVSLVTRVTTSAEDHFHRYFFFFSSQQTTHCWRRFYFYLFFSSSSSKRACKVEVKKIKKENSLTECRQQPTYTQHNECAEGLTTFQSLRPLLRV